MTEFKVPALPTETDKIETPKSSNSPSLQNTSKSVNSGPSQTSACPYKVPSWSGVANSEVAYKFEVFKSGVILEEIKDLQTKPLWQFGRLPENDIEMAHPTISRFHAVLQYRPSPSAGRTTSDESEDSEKSETAPEGWYIYDLGSTHGTFLNKQRIPPRVYIRIKVGHILKLGASTRCFLLHGPSEDEEPESELSITELKEKRQRDLEEAANEKIRKAQMEAERIRNEGISWGMSEDADEETDLTHNPYASTNNEELYLEDPKKTLRGYFEREGLSLEYKCDEMSAGSFICRVELPIDDANGRPIVAEVLHKGRKKDCVIQCALEACRILDRHGVLRQANQEPQKRKQLSKHSDSDEDDFWDRTGDIERKKQRKSNSTSNASLTYDDLLKQAAVVEEDLKKIEESIISYQDLKKKSKSKCSEKPDKEDDLDSFMASLNETPEEMDRAEIRKLLLESQRLKAEKQKLQRLVEIAKPADILSGMSTAGQAQPSNNMKKQFPMIGKRNQFSKIKILKPLPTKVVPKLKELASDEEEMEEDESTESVTLHQKPEEEDKKFENIEKTEPLVSNQPNEKKTEHPSENEMINDKSCLTNNFKKEEEKDEIESPEPAKLLRKNEEVTDNLNESKKKRNRSRIRHLQKEDMDMAQLDEHETSEKYSKWVPPENQSGDGFTSLNEKYGY